MVAVSHAPVVSRSSAPVAPLFVGRAVAAFPPAVQGLARFSSSLAGSGSRERLRAWQARLFLHLESGFCCALQLQV